MMHGQSLMSLEGLLAMHEKRGHWMSYAGKMENMMLVTLYSCPI